MVLISSEVQKKHLEVSDTTKYIIDKIIEFQNQGLSDREIAEQFGVSRAQVMRFRKRHGIPSVRKGRKSADIDIDLFFELYEQKLSDKVIAEVLGTSRGTVKRLREKYKLSPNRDVGKRGPGIIREDRPILDEARRLLKDPIVSRIVRKAVKEYRENGGDEVTAWAATVIEPARIFHPTPGRHYIPPEKTNLTHIKYALQVEKREDMAGICGVPSVELLEKARELRGAEEVISLSKLVAGSGFVGVHCTVEQARRKIDSVHSWNLLWKEHKEKSMKWAPVKKESQRRAQGYTDRRVSNGKRGKGGGCQNLEVRKAFAGAAGY